MVHFACFRVYYGLLEARVTVTLVSGAVLSDASMTDRKKSTRTRSARISQLQWITLLLIIPALFLGVFGYLLQRGDLQLGGFLADLGRSYATILAAELISIAVTLFVVDAIFRHRDAEQEKRELILQLGSPVNDVSREAIRRLRIRGWLSDGSLRHAYLAHANLRGAELGEADLDGANLREADLRGSDLRRVLLRGANLSGALLRGADLIGADLRGSDLRVANLSETYLRDANLQAADCSFADLSRADLRWAKMSGSNLSAANLEGANLLKADLSDANLNRVSLDRANLSDAEVTRRQIFHAKSLNGVTMPNGRVFEYRAMPTEPQSDVKSPYQWS
jgi:uncharacterized protein YjbI with pentapeptide repeats